MQKISILLVDDHRLVTDMWSLVLNKVAEFQIVGAVNQPEDTLRLVRLLKPDIVLMDIAMGPVNGIDLTRQIYLLDAPPKVIGVSMYHMPAYARRLMTLGASGYVTKNATKEELVYAIREVNSGRQYICDEVRNLIADAGFSDDASPQAALSRRELEIVALLRQGLSSREIGLRLELGTKTIETHRYRILKKMKLKNTAALVNYVNQNGL